MINRTQQQWCLGCYFATNRSEKHTKEISLDLSMNTAAAVIILNTTQL